MMFCRPGYAGGAIPDVQTYDRRWIDSVTGEVIDHLAVAERLGLPKDGAVPQLMSRMPVTAVEIASAQATRAWLVAQGAHVDLASAAYYR